MALQRQAALGAFWGTMERAATQGISFVVVLILARILGPESYGLVTLAATCALFGQVLLGNTFSDALIQAKTLEPAHIASVFWLLFGAGLAATAGLLLSADLLARIFGQPALATILRALSPLLMLSALQAVPTALFSRRLDFRALAFASSGGTLIGGATGVAMALAGFGVWSLIGNLLAQNVIVTLAIWRQARFRPVLLYSHRHLCDLWAYGQYSFLSRIAAFIGNQSPRILIGYLFGTTALGEFGLGLRVVEIMNQLLTLPAANVVVPVIAKLRHDRDRLERAVLGATQLVAMIAVPVFVGLILVAPTLVPVIFGLRWASSAVIVQILAGFGVVNSAGAIWGAIVGGLGRPDLNLAVATVLALTTVVLFLLTAPWGFEASSAVFVIRGCIVLPIQPMIIARLTGIRVSAQWRVLAPISLAATVMALLVSGFMAASASALSPPVLGTSAVIVGAAVYVLALCAFGRPALRLGLSTLLSATGGQAVSRPFDPPA